MIFTRFIAVILFLLGTLICLDAVLSARGIAETMRSQPVQGAEAQKWIALGTNVALAICAAKFSVGVLFIGFALCMALFAEMSERLRSIEKFAERIAWTVKAPTGPVESPGKARDEWGPATDEATRQAIQLAQGTHLPNP